MKIVFVIKIVSGDHNRWLSNYEPLESDYSSTRIIDLATMFDTYAEAEKAIPNLHKHWFYQIEKLYRT